MQNYERDMIYMIINNENELKEMLEKYLKIIKIYNMTQNHKIEKVSIILIKNWYIQRSYSLEYLLLTFI